MGKVSMVVDRSLSRQMASMVHESVSALQSQPVLAFDICMQHVDVHRELAHTSLKLKFRMNGLTYLKSAAVQPAPNVNGAPRINCNVSGTSLLEGDDVLRFELCKPSFLGSSRTLASCSVPLAEVLGTEQDHGACGRLWDLELLSNGTGKVLGNLAVRIGFQKSTFEAVDGMKLLRAVKLPQLPQLREGPIPKFASPDDAGSALVVVEEVDKARACLRAAFNVAMTTVAKNSRQLGPRPNWWRTDSTTNASDLNSDFSDYESVYTAATVLTVEL